MQGRGQQRRGTGQRCLVINISSSVLPLYPLFSAFCFLQEKFFNLPEEEHGQKLLADFQANAVRSQRSTLSALSAPVTFS